MKANRAKFLGALGLVVSLFLLSSCGSVSPEELAEKREEISRYENSVCTDAPGVVVCNQEGTVQYVPFLEGKDFPEMTDWEDIVQVESPENTCFVGLRKDGTCLSTGTSESGADEVSDWTGVVQLACCSGGSYGLRDDGVVLIAGGDSAHNAQIETWTKVKKIFVSRAWPTVYALTEEGQILCSYDNANFEDWSDIADFNYSGSGSMGIKADGSVTLSTQRDGFEEQVVGWTDIVETAVGGSGLFAGLQSDGRVVVAASLEESTSSFRDESLNEVSSWRNAVHIQADDELLIGITYDGEVLFAGNAGGYPSSYFKALNSEKAVYAYADSGFILLREDGTLDGFAMVDLKEFSPLW